MQVYRRISRPEVFSKKSVQQTFAKITEKHLWLNKAAGYQPETSLIKRLRHMFSSDEIFQTRFFYEIFTDFYRFFHRLTEERDSCVDSWKKSRKGVWVHRLKITSLFLGFFAKSQKSKHFRKRMIEIFYKCKSVIRRTFCLGVCNRTDETKTIFVKILIINERVLNNTPWRMTIIHERGVLLTFKTHSVK